MDRSRPETLEYPGEKWVKCCKKKGDVARDEDDSLTCVEVEVLDKLKLVDDFNGWCGRHYCMNAKDRCLKVGIKKETIEHARKGQCPSSCDDRCQKSTFKTECIYTGQEPKWGTEGKAVPAAQQG